jgi:hypothetical protein
VRSEIASRRRGRINAASTEPAPKAASASAVASSARPKRACTRTTVFTTTMAMPAATARLSKQAAQTGLAKKARSPRVNRSCTLLCAAAVGSGGVTATIRAAEARRPITAVMKTPRELMTVSSAAASSALSAFSRS